MKKIPALLAFICLAACASAAPPPATYAGTPSPKIVLDVASVNIVDHSNFQPSTSPYYTHHLTPTIEEAARQWLADHVEAGGTQGQALILIKDASLNGETLPTSQDLADKWFKRQQGSKYTGHVEVSVEIQGRAAYAIATAEAMHAVTLPETPTDTERQNLYVTLLNGLMKDFAQNLDASVREHMQNYVLPAQ